MPGSADSGGKPGGGGDAPELAAVVRLVLRGWQQDFPVIDQGHVVGMLTRRDLLAALATGQAYTRVNHCMRRDFPMAEAGEPLEPVLARMQQSEFDTIPALEGGRLLAVLTRENVAEYVMIHSALKTASVSARALSPAPRVEEVVANSLVQHKPLVDSLGGTTSGPAIRAAKNPQTLRCSSPGHPSTSSGIQRAGRALLPPPARGRGLHQLLLEVSPAAR